MRKYNKELKITELCMCVCVCVFNPPVLWMRMF